MILPDVNILVHAHNANSAVHERRAAGGTRVCRAPKALGLAWAVILGFVRITANRKVVARPLAVHNVMERLRAWLALPHVHVAQPSEMHFSGLRAELERLGASANLTTDAHLAVLAVERGYVLYSTDADFAWFAALRLINPCMSSALR